MLAAPPGVEGAMILIGRVGQSAAGALAGPRQAKPDTISAAARVS